MKLGMDHHRLNVYMVYINDDPGLTLICFTAMSNSIRMFIVFIPDQ